jgi:hypothetical protein
MCIADASTYYVMLPDDNVAALPISTETKATDGVFELGREAKCNIIGFKALGSQLEGYNFLVGTSIFLPKSHIVKHADCVFWGVSADESSRSMG